jgi:hypothetical protein
MQPTPTMVNSILPLILLCLSARPSMQAISWMTLYALHSAVNVELCTIPSYLNYILLYSVWLYKPARILVSA